MQLLITNNFEKMNIPIIVSTQCLRGKREAHIHPHAQLIYILSGSLSHICNGQPYEQQPGSCLLVFPHTSHQVDFTNSDDTPVAIFISFFPEFLTEHGYNFLPVNENVANFEGRYLPCFTQFEADMKVRSDTCIREIMAEFSKHNDMSYEKVASLLSKLLHMMCTDEPLDNATPTATHIKQIHNALTYISHNYQKKLTIDELCSVSAMSRCMFTKHFKEVTGATFANFLLSCRLHASTSYVLHSDLSLNEIAKKMGLNDKTHLCHMFTKHYGMSPMKYKEKNLPILLPEHLAWKKRWSWLDIDNEL